MSNARELAAGLVSGSTEAFGEIFEAEWDKCMRIAVSLLWPDRDGAADVVQESFMKLWSNRSSIDAEQGCSHWLHRCVRNLSIDRLRKKTPFFLLDEDAQPDMAHAPASEKPDEETIEHLRKALGSLGNKHRQVILLRFWQGFSVKEIADILDIPPGTVASRLSIAVKKLGGVLSIHESH